MPLKGLGGCCCSRASRGGSQRAGDQGQGQGQGSNTGGGQSGSGQGQGQAQAQAGNTGGRQNSVADSTSLDTLDLPPRDSVDYESRT
ncbi:hypothetical protein DL767_010830 [Monosporascus sp. MG133]|nr:hypothetical protein DL767_010830 [Monosporascus sp. MG133]